MRDQPRISVAGETMGGRRRESIEKAEDPPSSEEQSEDELLERLRQLEEEKARFEEEKKRWEEEKKSLEEENRRLEKEKERLEGENSIFRKYLESTGMSAEDFFEKYKALQHRLNLNSSNSSKPPSSDGYRKPQPKSLRVRTGRRPGGQPGHVGHHMVIPHEPDVVVDHIPSKCLECPRHEECRAGNVFTPVESRYVVEAVTLTSVIEHRALRAECPMAPADEEEPGTGSFPEDIKAHVQYGDSFTVLVGLLDNYGAMSDSRNSDLVDSLFGVTLSPGTVKNMRMRCARKIGPLMERVKAAITEGDVTNSDESGIRVNGKILWIHSSSTPEYTYQTLSSKRGVEGIEENGIIPKFKGTAVHDCWSPYFKYGHVTHAVCSAHLLRELAGIQDLEPCHVWPGHFVDLLIGMKSAKERAQADGLSNLTEERLNWFSARYDWVLEMADTECPPPPEPTVKKRGRRWRGKERSLIERLRKLKGEVCRFAHDFKVPFDNNLAERDLRGIKTKHKVSGCFRSIDGASDHITIHSFLSTARKQGVNMFRALQMALKGRPLFIP